MSSHCVECSTELEPWEGQAGPRTYLFTAREIAHGLKLVADGRSYRSAAAEVRVRANRARGGNRRSRSWRARRRDAIADGQLLANWVDIFAPALLGIELPSRWPERILVDSKEFRIVNGIKAGQSFHVFVAASYEWNRTLRKPTPVVWKMEAYPWKTQISWREFFLSLQGTPGIVVSDMDIAVRRAAATVFPRKGDPTPDIRMCEYHVKQRIENALSPIRGQPAHPLWAALEDAFFSPADWAAFEQLAWTTHAAANPSLKTMTNWLGQFGHEIAAQVHTRPRYGPHSIGPVEATLRKIDAAFLDRASSFGNRARMNLLLGLMTLSMQGKADELVWAEHIRRVLHPVGGYAPGQRPHDDPAGWPSLVA